MASPPVPPLAELHLHLYGCLSAGAMLRQLQQHAQHLDLTRYEQAYETAYGSRSPIREVLASCLAGDPAGPGRFQELFVFGEEDAGNFARFQAKFELIIAGSAFTFGERLGRALGQPTKPLLAAELHEVTASIVAEQRQQGIRYAEQRLLLDEAEQWEWALPIAAKVAAASSPDFTLRIAASLPRHDPWPHWERVSRLSAGEGGELLTGIDFCFIEEGHPPKDKAAFFAAVRDHNGRHPGRALAILYHVGESFTDKSLESAVRWVQEAAELGANRLGHAIALGIEPEAFLQPSAKSVRAEQHVRGESAAERIDQLRYDLKHAEGLGRHGVVIDQAAAFSELEKLLRGPADAQVQHVYDRDRLDEVRRRQDYAMGEVRRTGAVIEVCPTSNRRIGSIADAQHHPVHRFLDAGLKVVVASDDPGIFGTTLAAELDWVAHHAELSPAERCALLENAWRSRSERLTGRDSI